MDNELVGIVYADNLNDGFSIRYPAFSMDVLTNKAVINSPFLFKTGGGSRFDPKFTSLYLHRFITQATMPTRTAAHVAETLVAKLGGNISSVSIDELKNLNG
jgi:hypothetical protein